MNRLHHIMKTLPKNLDDNSNYPNLEFVLLDYGSEDGLEEWVHYNMQQELSAGLLVFSRTDEPVKYLPSHSKNMVHHQSTGDIVCNLDADNFTGPGFASYINDQFSQYQSIFLSPDYRNQTWENHSDTFGRIVCWKKDFESVGGYDESMKWYSYEDLDFCERLIRKGAVQRCITNAKYLETISHDDTARVGRNAASEITDILINYVDPLTSGLLFLFRNGNFSMGTVKDINKGFGTPVILEDHWLNGKYNFSSDHILLDFADDDKCTELKVQNNAFIDDYGCCYYLIEDPGFKKTLGMHFAIISNHQILVNNAEAGLVKVNKIKRSL